MSDYHQSDGVPVMSLVLRQLEHEPSGEKGRGDALDADDSAPLCDRAETPAVPARESPHAPAPVTKRRGGLRVPLKWMIGAASFGLAMDQNLMVRCLALLELGSLFAPYFLCAYQLLAGKS